MASRIATYEYLNSISSDDRSGTGNALKKCVNPYGFAMDQGQGGYYSDLEFIGSSPSRPPWPLATRDEFQVKALTAYYNPKLTLESQPTGYLNGAQLICGTVWNKKPSAYQGNNINVTNVTGFTSPAVRVQGGYSGASSTDSPTINGTALPNLNAGTFFDVTGGYYNPTSHSPVQNVINTITVQNGDQPNNPSAQANVSVNNTIVYVGWVYIVNNIRYVIWSRAILSLVTTYK